MTSLKHKVCLACLLRLTLLTFSAHGTHFLVGDITPKEGISKETKAQLETEAMHNFVHDMLHNSSAAQRIEALWHVGLLSVLEY